ncbi:MAG: DUF5654 family protein [Candidatus Paceibacterota bacterium]|jgi:uncharacterized membrane protein YidH (DUF202 family)|nr:DUF5654 family protein [Candidatus Pacearchaeota archaeon]
MKKSRKKVSKKGNPFKKEVAEKTITLILGAIGFIAALAWNDAIRTIFDEFIQPGDAILGKLLYALLVTVIFVLLSINLSRIISKKGE